MGWKTNELKCRSSFGFDFCRSGLGTVENNRMYLNQVGDWRIYREENLTTRQSSRTEKEMNGTNINK